jgi:hypothetical protein
MDTYNEKKKKKYIYIYIGIYLIIIYTSIFDLYGLESKRHLFYCQFIEISWFCEF